MDKESFKKLKSGELVKIELSSYSHFYVENKCACKKTGKPCPELDNYKDDLKDLDDEKVVCI